MNGAINKFGTSNDIVINNIEEYIQKINLIRESEETTSKANQSVAEFFFRGQATKSWNILPGVFRDSLLSAEHDLINMAIRSNPNDFRGLTDFEILTKLQHYGLPTRLLDVTTNPLVALFFACQSNKSDGAVYYKYQYVTDSEDKHIEILSYLAIHMKTGKQEVNYYLNSLEQKRILYEVDRYQLAKNRNSVLSSVLRSNYFVKPKMNNERIKRQDGAFLYVGNYEITNDGNGIYYINSKSKILNDDFENKRFIIPKARKSYLLKQLDDLGINEAKLFPELEHNMNYITSITKNKILMNTNCILSVEMLKANNLSDRDIHLNSNDSYEIIKMAISNNIDNEGVVNAILNILDNDKLSNDWYLNKSFSEMFMEHIEFILSIYPKYDANDIKIINANIVTDIREEIIKRNQK